MVFCGVQKAFKARQLAFLRAQKRFWEFFVRVPRLAAAKFLPFICFVYVLRMVRFGICELYGGRLVPVPV